MFQSRSPRYPVRFDAVIDDGEHSLSAPVTNLSDTGLFFETTTGLRPGVRVRVIPLTTEAGGLSEFEAEVVRTQDPSETGGVKRVPGIAVRFVHLLGPDKDRLREYCRRVLGGGTANDNGEVAVRTTKAPAWSQSVSRSFESKAEEERAKGPVTHGAGLDGLLDLTAEAALIADGDIDKTAVHSIVHAPVDESESDFFAKGESMAEGVPLSEGNSILEDSQDSVVVHVTTDVVGAAVEQNMRASEAAETLGQEEQTEQALGPKSGSSDDAASPLATVETQAVGGVEDTQVLALAKTRERGADADSEAQAERTDSEREALAVGPLGEEDGETEAFVYSDQRPSKTFSLWRVLGWGHEVEGPARAASDEAVDASGRERVARLSAIAAIGVAVALLLMGVIAGEKTASQQRSDLETGLLKIEGEVARSQLSTTSLARKLSELSEAEAASQVARGQPRATGTAMVTPIGNGANVLLEAKFAFENPTTSTVDLNFTRTRVFLKPLPSRAPGAAPLALQGPLERGAKGWIEIVEAAERSETPHPGEFAFSRKLKKRLGRATPSLQPLRSGGTASTTGRWVLAGGSSAVVAVVQEWLFTPVIDGDPGVFKRGKTVRTVSMVGLPTAK